MSKKARLEKVSKARDWTRSQIFEKLKIKFLLAIYWASAKLLLIERYIQL